MMKSLLKGLRLNVKRTFIRNLTLNMLLYVLSLPKHTCDFFSTVPEFYYPNLKLENGKLFLN